MPKTPTTTRFAPADEQDARATIGAAVQRFARRYGLVQKAMADIIGVSQPQISYMLGTAKAERPRSFSPWELYLMERHVKHETNPELVYGEILRDAGLVADATDLVRADRVLPVPDRRRPRRPHPRSKRS